MSEYQKAFHKLDKCFQNLYRNVRNFKELYVTQCKNGKFETDPLEKIDKLLKNSVDIRNDTYLTMHDSIFDLSLNSKIEIITHYCKIDNFSSFRDFVKNGKTCLIVTKSCDRHELLNEIRYILMTVSKFGTDNFLDSFEKEYFNDIFKRSVELSCHYYIGLIERGMHSRISNLPIGADDGQPMIRYIAQQLGTMAEYCNYINVINYLIAEKMHKYIVNSNNTLYKAINGNNSAMILLGRIMNKCKFIEDCDVNSEISNTIYNDVSIERGSSFVYYLIEKRLHTLKEMNAKYISKFENKYNNKKLHFENILKKSVFPKDLNNVILKYIGIYDMI